MACIYTHSSTVAGRGTLLIAADKVVNASYSSPHKSWLGRHFHSPSPSCWSFSYLWESSCHVWAVHRIKSQCWRVIHLHQWGNTLWGHLRCHLLPHDFEACALGLLPLVPWMDGNVSPHTCPPAPTTHWMGEVDRFLGQLNLPFKFRSLISVYSGTSRDSGCRLWLEMNIFQAVLRGFESQQCKTLPNRIF